MLLMVKKVLEVEYVTPFIGMWEVITDTWKFMINIRNYHFSNIET